MLEEAMKQAIAAHFYEASFRKLPTDIYGDFLSKMEKPLFEHVLRVVRGNQSRAADVLGMNRNTLRKRCAQYGIKPLDYTPYGAYGALQARN